MLTVLLPGLFAALVAVLVTLAIERWGGILGGLLGTLPSTIVPAVWGIWASTGPGEDFSAALSMVAPGMFLNLGFLLLWQRLPALLPAKSPRQRLAWMTLLSLGCWGLGALFLIQGLGRGLEGGLSPMGLGLLATLLMLTAGVAACWQPRPAPAGRGGLTFGVLLSRGLLAGLAISASALAARSGSVLLAGVASVFPAIFLTTMVSLWLSQGEQVPRGAAGPMMLGSSSVAAYALLAMALLPELGPALGSLLTWVLSVVLVTLPSWLWLRRRRESAQS